MPPSSTPIMRERAVVSRWPACTSSGLASSWKTWRWIATGASVTPTVANARHSRPTYHPRWKASSSPNRVLERQRGQEPGQQLDAGLAHAELLQQLVPVAVGPLLLGLVAVLLGHPPDATHAPAAAAPPDG